MSEDRAALRRDIRATLMPGFSGFTVPGWVFDAFAKGLLSVCVYGENIRDAEQLRALGAELRAACPDSLLAIDEEGGEVTRLHYLNGSPYPGAAVLGRIDDTDYTSRIGEQVGHDILSTGFNLALGPVADVNSNPRNPVIGTRSFASDPTRAGKHVASWILGLQLSGAIACAKHFPGHGDTSEDSHLALPAVNVPLQTLEQRELPPFRAAIEAGVGAIMTSHILLPQIDPTAPATFSRRILQGLLRDELEFDGVIVSDALDMQGASHEIGIPEAAVRALIAGCDLLCLGTSTGAELLQEIEDTILFALDSGRLREDRLFEAARRVRALATTSSRAIEEPLLNTDNDLDPDELGRIERSFDGLARARDWIAAHPHASIARIESQANMAVGVAPWGPFAAADHPLPGTEILAQRFAARHHCTVRVDTDTNQAATLSAGCASGVASEGIIVVGRDLHRMPEAQARILALRRNGTPVLIVEMGWPGARREENVGSVDFTQLSCYGSSRLIGAAVLQLVEGNRL